ncbi:unnamed protein product [Prunus armeniaca]|uniref:Uncharacterized protein n=1 Tax=Prunus armeniaca TaxID=36596 RepID=A0A6J5UXF9_PRUAR|nr:unnamed protein product [Prunus armeniaca]
MMMIFSCTLGRLNAPFSSSPSNWSYLSKFEGYYAHPFNPRRLSECISDYELLLCWMKAWLRERISSIFGWKNPRCLFIHPRRSQGVHESRTG